MQQKKYNLPYLTSGIVIELSAIFVHKTIFRTFGGAARKTLCCSSNVIDECNGINRYFSFDLFIRKEKILLEGN